MDQLQKEAGSIACVRGRITNTPYLTYGGGVTPLCRIEIDDGKQTVVLLATAQLAETCAALKNGQNVTAWGKLIVERWRVGDGGKREQPQIHLMGLEKL